MNVLYRGCVLIKQEVTLLSFKIQILTEIIKDKRLEPIDFALYTKITDLYNIKNKS